MTTLASVGAVALTEGLKFLYGLAGEALKYEREWIAANAEGRNLDAMQSVEVELPYDAFEGQLKELQLDLTVVERLNRDLRDLRAAVADYAQGIDQVDPTDKELLETVEGLRRSMETVFGQRIAFKGEPGPPSGVEVVGEAKVEEVLGYVAALRARRILGGHVTGRLKVGTVEAGGEVVGIDLDSIGNDDPHTTGQPPPI